MQHCNDKDIPLNNKINIASDGASVMTGKVKEFVFRMISSALHIICVACIIQMAFGGKKMLEESCKNHS